MELYDEGKMQKQSKAPAIIGICIAILVVMTIIVFSGIIFLKNSITKIQIDGIRNTELEQILYLETTEEGNQLYIPIIKMAKHLGYEGFNGDYKNKSEDKTKCHVTCEDETAMFSLNSDILIKITEDSENEYVKLDEPVFEKDGELYTTIDGIQKAFNVLFSYDEEFKNIEIYSMNFLLNYYATNLKLEEYSIEFVDQKAVLENMIVVEENKQFGVIEATTGNAVLESKYEEIKYLPATTEFLVKSNGKYGVAAKDASIVIKTVYDEIKTIDNQNGLYLVKQNNSYGVIDTSGNIIIEPEYKEIGVSNIDKYTQNGVENKYVLLEGIIPVKNKEDLWGFFDIKGQKITEFKYTGVGCQTTPTSNNTYPALVIPSYKIIIVQVDKNYNLINFEGQEMITGNILGSIYLKYDGTTGQNKFFMTSSNNEKVINIEEWLVSIGQ